MNRVYLTRNDEQVIEGLTRRPAAPPLTCPFQPLWAIVEPLLGYGWPLMRLPLESEGGTNSAAQGLSSENSSCSSLIPFFSFSPISWPPLLSLSPPPLADRWWWLSRPFDPTWTAWWFPYSGWWSRRGRREAWSWSARSSFGWEAFSKPLPKSTKGFSAMAMVQRLAYWSIVEVSRHPFKKKKKKKNSSTSKKKENRQKEGEWDSTEPKVVSCFSCLCCFWSDGERRMEWWVLQIFTYRPVLPTKGGKLGGGGSGSSPSLFLPRAVCQ